MSKLNINRRNFLKAAGVATGVGAAAAATAVALPTTAKAEYNQPASWGVNMAITYLDEYPYNLEPYADGSKLERMPGTQNAFANANIKTELFGGSAYGVLMNASKIENMVAGTPGYSLRDHALQQGVSVQQKTLNTLADDWGTDFTSTELNTLGKWEDTPERNSIMIKKACWYYNKCVVGIAALNRQWVFASHASGNKYTFTDEVTVPTKTDTEYLIPESMNSVIVIGVPKDREIYKFAPALLSLATGTMGYADALVISTRITTFIRTLGYNAVTELNSMALNIPLAIDAGLGELGRHGLLINPEYGTMIKLIKVITDMPLAYDKPITFGAANFCKTCGKCAEVCPSKSISFDEETSYDTYCESNLAGMKKWYVNTWSCLEYWTTSGNGCGACAAACTYSKPMTWVHDVVKVVSSKTSMFNKIFATMDDAFGYGSTLIEGTNVEEIEEWWYDGDIRNFNFKYQ